jgi:hypothetical protein
MVTIQHLEVQFDVAGDAEERAFGKLFQKYMQQWHRLQTEAAARQRLSDDERAVGPRGGDDA